MNFRLTKSHRMVSSREFSQVFEKPLYRVSSRSLLLLAIDNEKPCPRLGLVVSKKNVGCAVARNRIKRLCRETFRLRHADFATIDIVVLARTGLNDMDNKAVVTVLNGLFDQLCVRQKQERQNRIT